MKFSRGSGVSALDWTGGPVAAHERILRRIRGIGATPMQLRTAPVVRSSAVSTARPYTFTQQQPGASSITISRAPGGSGPSTATSSGTTLSTSEDRKNAGLIITTKTKELSTAEDRVAMGLDINTGTSSGSTATPTTTTDGSDGSDIVQWTPGKKPTFDFSTTPGTSTPSTSTPSTGFVNGGYYGGSTVTPTSTPATDTPTAEAASTTPDVISTIMQTPEGQQLVQSVAAALGRDFKHRLVLTKIFIPAPFPVFSTSGYVFKVVK